MNQKIIEEIMAVLCKSCWIKHEGSCRGYGDECLGCDYVLLLKPLLARPDVIEVDGVEGK